MRLQQMFQPFGVVDGGRPAGGGLAGPVQAGVHGDAMQPSSHGRLPAEGVCCSVRGHQGILHRVGGLLTVSQGAQRHRPEPVPVASYQLTEGVRVPRDMAGQENFVGIF
jgi:hypothetical protein